MFQRSGGVIYQIPRVCCSGVNLYWSLLAVTAYIGHVNSLFFKISDLNLLDWNSKNLVAVALNSSTYMWNAETHKTLGAIHLNSDSKYVSSVAWINHGNCLAIGTSDGEVQVIHSADSIHKPPCGVKCYSCCCGWWENKRALIGAKTITFTSVQWLKWALFTKH